MVRAVNAILFKAVRDSGPNIRFVDCDAEVTKVRGRYCESRVLEPAPNRADLVFYEWNTVDMGENRTALLNGTGGGVPKGFV